jgi:hypothetical protein
MKLLQDLELVARWRRIGPDERAEGQTSDGLQDAAGIA